MKPLIGIMMRCSQNENGTSMQYVFENGRIPIVKAGGEPFFLTPLQGIDYFKIKHADYPDLTTSEKDTIDFWLDCIHGLFIPGGSKFTEYDRYVLKRAIEKKIPVLAVCLGMQVMSVYEEEVELFDVENLSLHNTDQNQQYAHKVKIDRNSKLYQIIGNEEIMVNSFHCKCASPNRIYKTVAMSEDGVIEALEYPGEVFHIGVQWHPEKMYDYDIYAQKLINAFIYESSLRKTKLDFLRKENFTTIMKDVV